MNVGFLYSQIRIEEKMLLKEFERRNISVEMLDDRQLSFSLDNLENYDFDVVLGRSISHLRSLYALRHLNHYGIPTVNSYEVALICGDKVLTSLALEEARVPTPRVRIAFTQESALRVIEELGYPVVMKPVIGSWGRLVTKINNREMAEKILEHRSVLGTSPLHSIYYIQEYVEKPGRDIRAFVVGNDTIAAVYRISEHWITNTARDAKTSNCPLTEELNEICAKAASSVGGGVLAVDLMEAPNGLTVHEVNYRMEFRNSIKPTGVDIPARIVDYVLEVGRDG